MRLTSAVERLSHAQKSLLVSHAGGPVRVNLKEKLLQAPRNVLMTSGFIKGDAGPSRKPARTILTEKGREAVCELLAYYAELLVLAGCLDRPFSPEEIGTQITARLQTKPAKSPNLKNSEKPESSAAAIGL